MKRRTLLRAFPTAVFLATSLWASSQQGNDNLTHSSTTIYELRIYQAAPGKLAQLLARFREHTSKLFDRHGMKNGLTGRLPMNLERSNTLIYILEHPSREAAATNWKSFEDDPEWKNVRDKSEANGKLVENVESTFLVLTDFSPALR